MCAYTRDWVNANPIDHTKFSAQPGGIRAHKVDIEDRLKNLFNGFISGETSTNEGVKNLPFVVQGSDPGATANKIKLYSKDVSAKAELHAQDEDGNVIQLTSGGAISASGIIQTIYPVGSLYITTVATNPATVLGFGTWSVFGAGKVLVSLDSGDGDFDTSEETGGAKTHTNAAGTLKNPAHGHDDKTGGVQNVTAGTGPAVDANDKTHDHPIPTEAEAQITGSTAAGSSVQPYIVCHIFKRDS